MQMAVTGGDESRDHYSPVCAWLVAVWWPIISGPALSSFETCSVPFSYPSLVIPSRRPCTLPCESCSGVSSSNWQQAFVDSKYHIPTVANHAHSLFFSHAVELGTLLKILLAADTLGVAETCLGKGVHVTPSWRMISLCNTNSNDTRKTYCRRSRSNAMPRPCLVQYPIHSCG